MGARQDNRRYVLFLAVLYFALLRPVHAYSDLNSCYDICTNSTDCGQPCTANHYDDTTCGDFGVCGGYNIGWCGNGTCDENESSWCCNDCGGSACTPPPASVRYPNDNLNWASITTPNQSLLEDLSDSCAGLCGKGCSGHPNPCLTPDPYWELDFVSGPYNDVYYEQHCNEAYELVRRTYSGWHGQGRWSLHGWTTLGCTMHDATCAFDWWWPGCWWSPGPGLCDINVHEDSWSYQEPLALSDLLSIDVVGSCNFLPCSSACDGSAACGTFCLPNPSDPDNVGTCGDFGYPCGG